MHSTVTGCRVAGRRINGIINSNRLGNGDRVATVIGNTIGTGDNLRTGVAITHITDKSNNRCGGTVIRLVGYYRDICTGTSPMHSTVTGAGLLAVGSIVSSTVIVWVTVIYCHSHQ